jgi:hypothetical protein
LHLEVLVVAPGCAVAGWWQATRALSGNELSWFYSVEWPVFALLAIWGWWHLLHEDPDAYRRRKSRGTNFNKETTPEPGPPVDATIDGEPRVDTNTVLLARALLVLVAAEFLLGVAAMIAVPFSRPSGWVPTKGGAVYLAHAVLGVVVVVAAVALLFRGRGAARTSLIVGWLGLVSLVVAAAGGLLTEAQSTVRFFGMAVMLIGTAFAFFSYMIPTMLTSSSSASRSDEEAAGAEKPPSDGLPPISGQ